MAGQRRWLVFVNAAASGRRASALRVPELVGRWDAYPKSLAQLESTSRDVDALTRWWETSRDYPEPVARRQFTIHEATYQLLVEKFDHAVDWMRLQAEQFEDSFDGGCLVFAFSGHGRAGDGALQLAESTFFSGEDLLEQARRLHAVTGKAPRIVLLLDSCFSGEFVLRALHGVLANQEVLGIEYMLASSMPDEASWEIGSLKQGRSTFCFLLQPPFIGAEIVVHPVDGVRTWSIMQGPDGCSYATGAMQNPLVIDTYGSSIRTCHAAVEPGATLDETRERVLTVRDSLRERLEPFRTIQRNDLTDEEIDQEIDEQIALQRRARSRS